MADRETSSTESLVQYFANLPELERDVLRRLSVLHWFDRALYEYIQDMDSPLEFEQVTRLAAMSPLNRTTQRERFVIIPDLRRKLAADLREERYEEYITVNRLAASYFHRPLSHVDSTTVGDVIEELGYLAVADPDQAALRLAMFARAALLSGWAEAASRAARAVGIAPSELSGHSRAFPVARLVDALATILSEAGVGTPSTAGLLSIVGDISIPRNDAEDALVTLAHQALDRFPADRRATGDRSSRIELSSRDSVYAWGRVVEKGFPESVGCGSSEVMTSEAF